MRVISAVDDIFVVAAARAQEYWDELGVDYAEDAQWASRRVKRKDMPLKRQWQLAWNDSMDFMHRVPGVRSLMQAGEDIAKATIGRPGNWSTWAGTPEEQEEQRLRDWSVLDQKQRAKRQRSLQRD